MENEFFFTTPSFPQPLHCDTRVQVQNSDVVSIAAGIGNLCSSPRKELSRNSYYNSTPPSSDFLNRNDQEMLARSSLIQDSNRKTTGPMLCSFPFSQELYSVSEPILGVKRKEMTRCKPQAASISLSSKTARVEGGSVEESGRRNKQRQSGRIRGKEGTDAVLSAKPPEPAKGYIHVRARRGEATDSHSLAERVRREKISERMKLLQDLVPGCSKVSGKALMLDEIINYVQSLQHQVEFLSMKLASVNLNPDMTIENLLQEDVHHNNNNCNNGALPHSMYPSDSSTPAICSHQQQQSNRPDRPPTLCNSVDPLRHDDLDPDPTRGSLLPQETDICEDELRSVVQMAFKRSSPSQQRRSFQG